MSSPYEVYEVQRKLELRHVIEEQEWFYVASGSLQAMWKCFNELAEKNPDIHFRIIKTTISEEIIKEI